MHTAINMTPNHHFILKSLPMEPVSRTYQYRKIVKPILERKRRGRINKCLDELKDLMSGTLQADGENISKLEKADILELTVRHLQRLREKDALFVKHNDTVHMEKFWSGFQHCASEVAQFLNKYDRNITTDLIQYIANYVPNVTTQSTPAPITIALRQSLNMTNIIMRDTTTAAYCQRLGGSKNNSIPTLTTITTNSHCNHKEIKTLGTYSTMTVPLHTKKEMVLEKEENNVWRPW